MLSLVSAVHARQGYFVVLAMICSPFRLLCSASALVRAFGLSLCHNLPSTQISHCIDLHWLSSVITRRQFASLSSSRIRKSVSYSKRKKGKSSGTMKTDSVWLTTARRMTPATRLPHSFGTASAGLQVEELRRVSPRLSNKPWEATDQHEMFCSIRVAFDSLLLLLALSLITFKRSTLALLKRNHV